MEWQIIEREKSTSMSAVRPPEGSCDLKKDTYAEGTMRRRTVSGIQEEEVWIGGKWVPV